MDFSCIMPTRGRPDLLKNCLHSFFKKAANPDRVEFWLAIDLDDSSNFDLDYFACNNKYNVNYIKVPRSTYFHRDYHNRLIRLCQGKYIVGLNDECEILQHGWDDLLRSEIESFLVDKPDRIAYVYANDTTHVGNNPFTNKGSCFPIFTREAVAAAGCYIPDEIRMWSGDLVVFTIYSRLCEPRILDLQHKITIQHHSCHNRTRASDENTNRIEQISRNQPITEEMVKKYVDRLNAEIRRVKPITAPPKFVMADFPTNVSTDSPFLTGLSFETVRYRPGIKLYHGTPFNLKPLNGPNAVVLRGPLGSISQSYSTKVSVPCGKKIQKIHILGCTAGWGYQGKHISTANNAPSVSTTIRVNHACGRMETFDLINGVHIADFHNRTVNVSGSSLVDYSIEGHPIRCALIDLTAKVEVASVDLVKPEDDNTCPIYLAMTFEV